MPSIRRLALVLLLVAGLLVPQAALGAGPAAQPIADGTTAPLTTAAFPPLPACRYVDVATRFGAYRNWRKTLVDTNLMVGKAYRPPDLVSVSQAGIGGSGMVRALVIDDLRAMAAAARKAGAGIAVRSAFRSYTEQISVFNGWVAQQGYQMALLYSARAGHSEHQLGTTIDFRSANSALPPWGYTDWAKTPSGHWMGKHAWQYGFILSYPKGKTSETCYGYEPWHFRYVGRDEARLVHQSGLTLRRYLWRNFETAG